MDEGPSDLIGEAWNKEVGLRRSHGAGTKCAGHVRLQWYQQQPKQCKLCKQAVSMISARGVVTANGRPNRKNKGGELVSSAEYLQLRVLYASEKCVQREHQALNLLSRQHNTHCNPP